MDDLPFDIQIFNYLKEKGIKEELVGLFLAMLAPYLQDIIQLEVAQALTEDEIRALEVVAQESDFTDQQKLLLTVEAVKDKSGKDIISIREDFWKNIYEQLIKTPEMLDTVGKALSQTSEEERNAKMEEIIERIIAHIAT